MPTDSCPIPAGSRPTHDSCLLGQFGRTLNHDHARRTTFLAAPSPAQFGSRALHHARHASLGSCCLGLVYLVETNSVGHVDQNEGAKTPQDERTSQPPEHFMPV